MCKFGGGHTNLWTNFDETKKAGITEIKVDLVLEYVPGLRLYLRAELNPNIWNVGRFGLLYTDDIFEEEVRRLVSSLGLPSTAKDVHYSEHGMQGPTYVHFDVSDKWIKDISMKQLILGLIETAGITMS